MENSEVIRLYNIFSSNDWHKNHGKDIVFANFCNLLSNLSESQRKLVFELAERYTWINHNEYQEKIINALNSIEPTKLSNYKNIFLFPIMKPKDETKIKSGRTLVYIVNALKPLLVKYSHTNFFLIDKFENLSAPKFTIKNDESIFLIDDYLGSGETIDTTLREIFKNNAIKINHINVISIAAQEETIKTLLNNGISIYNDFVSRKGISDFNASPELEEKMNIMLEIEKLIPGGKKYSFGYNRTEALITLLRTPNNTFPIFWKEYRKNNEKFEAPFSRF